MVQTTEPTINAKGIEYLLKNKLFLERKLQKGPFF